MQRRGIMMAKRLFVWTDFCPYFTSGLAFAIADSLEEARELINKENGYEIDQFAWGTLKIYSLKKSRAFSVHGGG